MKPEQLHARFALSGYGYKLNQEVRFGDFKPEYIPNKLWEKLLGDDVNNLKHMPHTLEITRRFQRAHRIGGELLRLTAISHDWGEAVVGDVALPDKQLLGTDIEEIHAYEVIAANLLGDDKDLLIDVPEVIWGEHKLSEPFNVIEYIGYCQTGLKAGRMACLLANGIIRPEIPRAQTDGLIGGLLALNKLVEVKNYPKLRGYVDKYPYIDKVMI